MNLDLGVLCEV